LAVSVDTLSDVLQAVRLKGAVFFDIDTTAPWVAEAPPAKIVAPAVMPDSEHVIEYHVITSGSCWASVIGRDIEPVRATAGDVIAFPQGDAHVLSSSPGMRGGPDLSMFKRPENAAQLPLLLNLDGGGKERTHIVCGFLGCDSRPFNPLLESLPRILHVRGSNTAGGLWRGEFTRFAVMEAKEKRAGGNGILSKLRELMFVELVRRYVESLPEESTGWLAGLKDRYIGRALNLLHARPALDWTLDQLAKDVGLSRSSFAERFTVIVGVPPMQYLQKWRLPMAASRLSEVTSNAAKIAAEVGYESEAAFSRAFKKTAGVSPAQWRSKRTTAGASPRL
jgi:AraC-like DNA-binding protein